MISLFSPMKFAGTFRLSTVVARCCITSALVFVLLLVAGCAKRPVGTREAGRMPEQLRARAAWDRFQERDADGESFSATASLNLTTPTARRRVRLRIWGNTMGPVRLDLIAGVGVTAGMWREDEQGFLAYIPQAATAYRSPSGRQGMAAFGLPETFSLRELALTLCGRFSPLFPQDYESARLVPDSGFAYTFSQGQTERQSLPGATPAPPGQLLTAPSGQSMSAVPAQLLLDAQGRPVSYFVKGENPWRLSVSGWTDPKVPGGADVPELVLLEWNGGKAKLYIKQAEFRAEPWSEESLALNLPPGTLVRVKQP